MRTLSFLLVITMVCGCAKEPTSPSEAQSESDPLASLGEYSGSHRLILIHANSTKANDAISALKERGREIDDRDILWFVLTEGRVTSNQDRPLASDFAENLMLEHFVDASGTEVRLIGKDGGLKKTAAVLDLDALFALIDTMPMRKREMKERGR